MRNKGRKRQKGTVGSQQMSMSHAVTMGKLVVVVPVVEVMAKAVVEVEVQVKVEVEVEVEVEVLQARRLPVGMPHHQCWAPLLLAAPAKTVTTTVASRDLRCMCCMGSLTS